MKGGGKTVFVSVVVLWIAAGLQGSLAPLIGFGYGHPDFLLIALACCGMYSTRQSGAILGFGSGFLQGAMAGANMSAYIITRALVGLFEGYANELEFEGSVWVAALVTVCLTILAQLMLMFAVHRGALIPFLTGTIIQAATNGVLAMPVYALLRRILEPPVR